MRRADNAHRAAPFLDACEQINENRPGAEYRNHHWSDKDAARQFDIEVTVAF